MGFFYGYALKKTGNLLLYSTCLAMHFVERQEAL
jgi:hypothetical protein